MLRRAHALLLVSSFAAALSAQSSDAAATPPTASALEQALRDCVAGLAEGAARAALERYEQALGTRGEAAVIALLIVLFGDAPPDRVPTLDEARMTELFDRVAFHRRRGHPERMLPALLLLQRALPDDVRVQFALGEAFGVQSAVFDARKAEQAFARAYDLLLAVPATPSTPHAQARELARFLPELAGAGDRTAWFRQRLRGFCETLRDGQPIGLWKLRDPRLEELQEDLRVVLPRGFQKEVIDVLEQMRAIHPDDPASCYMLAQVHASLGPAQKPERAIELFRQFLDLTAESRFEQAPDAESPIMSRADVARRLAGLQLATAKDDLQALRIAAKETLILLTPAKGKPPALLFFPELSFLERATRELANKLAKAEGDLNKEEARLQRMEREMESAKADYERWKAASRGRRGYSDPQPWVDAIQGRKQNIEKLEKKLGPTRDAVAAQRRLLQEHETRLRQFGR